MEGTTVCGWCQCTQKAAAWVKSNVCLAHKLMFSGHILCVTYLAKCLYTASHLILITNLCVTNYLIT